LPRGFLFMAKRSYYKKAYNNQKTIFFLKGLGFLVIFLFLIFFIIFIYFTKDLPRPEKFTETKIIQSTKIYDRSGKNLLYEIAGSQKRTVVPFEVIPNNLKNAIISIEDKDFFNHKGVDFRSVFRAILYDLKLKKPVQGASTITQQLIRSYFLNRKKTLKRKTREIILSLELEKKYSKQKILNWYLNLIPFGSNVYGVEEASQMFFGKSVSNISLNESAVLAALIQAPSYLSPYGKNIDKLIKRKNYVLEKMFQLGFISKEQLIKNKQEKVVFKEKSFNFQAPHFVIFIKNYLEKKYGKDFLEKKGLKVYTTLNLDYQKKAEELLKTHINNIKSYNVYNGALIVLNNKTGEILAMVGSKDYFGEPEPIGCTPGLTCQFDPKTNVTLSLRQPGSVIKPIIYVKSFQKGLSPNSMVWDVKTEFNLNCPPEANKEFGENNSKCYHPKNYDGKFLGLITLRSALAQSRNLPAVKVLYVTGLKNILDFIPNFGITTLKEKQRYGLSLVLGGGEVKLIEMVRAFSVFANDGFIPSLNFITKIEDSNGNIIEKEKINKIKIIPSQNARQINSILSDNNARAPMFGLNSVLNIKDYQVAVKTGTTQNYNDAWIIGYSPSITVGVWAGNNNNSPMKKLPAVSLVGPIWNKLIRYILKTIPKEDFIKPKKTETIFNKNNLKEHSILYYINKKDPQFPYWEKGVQYYLNRFNGH